MNWANLCTYIYRPIYVFVEIVGTVLQNYPNLSSFIALGPAKDGFLLLVFKKKKLNLNLNDAILTVTVAVEHFEIWVKKCLFDQTGRFSTWYVKSNQHENAIFSSLQFGAK